MAENFPKFEGEVLDIGNDYFLVKKSVVIGWYEHIERLEKDLQEMKVKPVEKKTGVVTGKEGRNEVLNSEQKGQVMELRKRGYSLRQIAEVFHVSHETVRRVVLENESEVRLWCDTCQEMTTFISYMRGVAEACSKCGVAVTGANVQKDIFSVEIPSEEDLSVDVNPSTPAQQTQTTISSNPLEGQGQKSNIFGTISSDFRKRD